LDGQISMDSVKKGSWKFLFYFISIMTVANAGKIL
jgi:hypothetical protein